MVKRILILTLLMLLPLMALHAQVTVSGVIDTDTEWTSDNEYLLDGVVFVASGAKLFIEAGTVIKAEDGEGNSASALVVSRGGQIFAEGTPNNPIIFTSVNDDLSDPNDLTQDMTGEWGGVVILGSAPTNNPAEKLIEGINEINSDPAFSGYGGNNPEDNSGVFRYVSIRHTGINVGAQAANEIQGLTLGGVGSGTTVEFVESFASADDGFEFFGGTVNTRNLVSAFVEDDGFDWDEGFRGKGQFWFVLSDDDAIGHMAEMDGSTAAGDASSPYAYPVIANATYIGPGVSNTTVSGDVDQSLLFRDNTGALYINSIFADDSRPIGVFVEDTGSDTDSESRLAADSLNITNSVFFDMLAGNSTGVDDLGNAAFTNNMLSANNNGMTDPEFGGISRTTDGGLDPRPNSSTILSGATDVADSFFKKVPYQGAFGSNNWLTGWTALDQLGYIATSADPSMVTVTSNISGDEYWTADNEYLLDGVIFVPSDARLFIEAGTVIKAEDGEGNSASALVVSRGGQIFAEGEPGNPIIFTSVNDDLSDPNDLTQDMTGEWGGVVILGNAPTNNPAEKLIEGINEINSDPAFSGYGGDLPEDNSGIFRYVSIRHTGINVGAQAANEIQGLTLGGVGSGTTIEYVESFASADDGFEFFGGTVNTRYLVSAFVEDDGFDWDEGFRGKGQFWFVLSDDDAIGHMAEMDGSTAAGDASSPYAYPQIANATYIGPGVSNTTVSGDVDQSLLFRDNTGALYINSIFADDSRPIGVFVEDTGSDTDSESRLAADSLNITNSIFFDMLAGNSTGVGDLGNEAFTNTMLSANSNALTNPEFFGISRTANGTLDPRPQSSAVLSGATTVDDDFFYDVAFQGAFGTDNWLVGWTALSELGYTTTTTYTDIDDVISEVPESITLKQNYPNPFNPSTQISFTLPNSENVTLEIYEITGRRVATLVDGVQPAGTNTVRFDASNLSSGMYIYRLQSNSISLTRKMMLIK